MSQQNDKLLIIFLHARYHYILLFWSQDTSFTSFQPSWHYDVPILDYRKSRITKKNLRSASSHELFLPPEALVTSYQTSIVNLDGENKVMKSTCGPMLLALPRPLLVRGGRRGLETFAIYGIVLHSRQSVRTTKWSREI